MESASTQRPVARILAVGDHFLDVETLREIVEPGLPDGVEFQAVQWETEGREDLQEFNALIEQNGPGAVEPPAALLERIGDADILFTQFCPLSRETIDAAGSLRVIGLGRSGTENVDVEAATERGISVLNTVGRNAEAVAEYTIGLLLCEARNIARAHAALKQGKWRKNYPNDETVPELPGRTLGTIGLGQIGRLIVERLSGFEMRFLAHDPYASPESAARLGVKLVDLRTLMEESDFVTVHARLTEETRGLVGRQMLELMKPTAYLINTARAEIVDEAALVDSLREGRIAGAALDVFASEPLPDDSPLPGLDRVTLSPHQAGVTADAYRTTARLFLQNISRLWEGSELPHNLLNPETEDKLRSFKERLQEELP